MPTSRTSAASKQAHVVKTLARRGIRLQKKLGSGGFGAVHQGMCDQYSRPVAIKVIEFGKDEEGNVKSSEREEFDLEVQALDQAKESDYVVDLKKAFTVTDGEKGIIVMELGDGMDLYKYMSRTSPIPQKEALWIGLRLARGIADLHDLNLVHRDLKGGNVILFKNTNGKLSNVKIVDFGMAAKEGDYQWVGGTLPYMSDDRVADYYTEADTVPPVTKADDIFAFGCIMMELLGGHKEFNQWNKTRRDFLESGKNRPVDNTLEFPKRIRAAYSEKLIDALQACLHDDPEMRPTAAELGKLFGKTRHPAPTKLPLPAKKLKKRQHVQDDNAFPIALRVKKRRRNVLKK